MPIYLECSYIFSHTHKEKHTAHKSDCFLSLFFPPKSAEGKIKGSLALFFHIIKKKKKLQATLLTQLAPCLAPGTM